MPQIFAQPYDYELPPQPTLALIVIDMQRDFMEAGGFGDILGNDVDRLRAIVPTLKRLLEGCRDLKIPIFHTVEGHQPDLSDCPESKRKRGKGAVTIGDESSMGRILILGEPGNGIIPELAPLPGEILISKPGKGAFYKTNLELHLKARNITHLLITGVTTEVCVQTTMREANDRGYECLLVEDATESYFPEFKQSTLEMVRAQGGIIGWTAPTEAVLQGLKQWQQEQNFQPLG
jgi:biuret amidohydrolase